MVSSEPGGCPAFPTLQTLLSARPTLCATDGPYIVFCCPHAATESQEHTKQKPKVGKTTLEPTTTKPDESEKETSTKKSTEEREKTTKKPEVTTAKPEPKTTTLAPTTREPERTTTTESTPATKKTPPPPPPPPPPTTTSSPPRRPSFNSSPFLLAGGLFVTPPKHLEAPTEAPLVDLPPVPALSALPAARLAGAEECGRPSAPWVALVGSRRHWLCAGALLGPRLILTAARCVEGRTPEDLVVRLGEGGETVMSGVLRAVIHPLHSGGRHDLALLLLAGGPSEGGVCLSSGRPAAELRTLGRGVSPFGTSGPVGPLQSTTMSEVRGSDCDAAYRVLPTYRREFPLGISGTEVCVAAAGPDTVERRCPQDRGGPLVTTGRGGRLQLVGLMREAAGCGTTVFPNVYTRLSEYSTWIGRTAAELAA
ncbi:transmembrane protease serine 9-like [Amphibalanus amphitrite]|uniref:transmembrane protease serine 9-like n=1 Tax=Amphibalanus amphitrite TaxID=1232801 RepID=UPI001C900B80|nr:transmembrane protease serine 9-like [Amphibalanus amphitrite]